LFGIAIAAQKNISNKTSFHSSIGYLYQQFSNILTIFKDSASPVLIERNAEKFNLHFINLYTGISYRLAAFDVFKLSVGGGIDNQFMIALQSEQNKYIYNSGQSLLQKNNSLHHYNTWQPHLRIHVITDVSSDGRNSLQLTPYLRYGLRKFEKSGDKNHLMSFGIAATYFLR